MLHLEKNQDEKRQRMSFRPQRWHTFPTGTTRASCEKLWFVRSLDQNLPQMEQFFYQGMLVPFHDTMPSLMNFRRVSDLLEFENQALKFAAKPQIA